MAWRGSGVRIPLAPPPNTRPVNNDRPCSLKRPDFRAYARKVGCGCEPPRRSLMGRRDGFAFAGGVFASDCDGLLIHVLECVAQYAAVVDIMLVCPGVEPSGMVTFLRTALLPYLAAYASMSSATMLTSASSSSGCTSRGSLASGTVPPSSSSERTQPLAASSAMSRASARFLPSVTHPGRSGTSTAYPPLWSSNGIRMMGYANFISSSFRRCRPVSISTGP